MAFGLTLFSQIYPEDPVGETEVNRFCFLRNSSFALHVYWALLHMSLSNYVSVFFFWLDIAVLVDYFQAVRMFLVFSYFIEFRSPSSFFLPPPEL